MGIQNSTAPTHWNYFLSLEEDIDRLSRYIEFTGKNFECFSLELTRILLTTSSEVDVVTKRYCNALNTRNRAQSIGKYKEEILAGNLASPATVITMPRYALTFTPWSAWSSQEASPYWWQSHTIEKHQRHTHFERPNLKNALNSIAGLFVLLIHYYQKQAEKNHYKIVPKTFKNPGYPMLTAVYSSNRGLRMAMRIVL